MRPSPETVPPCGAVACALVKETSVPRTWNSVVALASGMEKKEPLSKASVPSRLFVAAWAGLTARMPLSEIRGGVASERQSRVPSFITSAMAKAFESEVEDLMSLKIT